MPEHAYKDPRPPEYFARFHERARRREPDWMYTAVRIVATPPTVLLFRLVPLGTDNVPTSGPVIFAPNHVSNWDNFFSLAPLRRQIHLMGKSQVFSSWPAEFVFSHGGIFPVRRGHRDEEAFITAHTILARGGCVLMFPEGRRSHEAEFGRPRPGVGRLALESGAPVVPVAIRGSDRIRGWTRRGLPQVTIRYGEPITLEVLAAPSRDQQQAAADAIFSRVCELHAEVERHVPHGVVPALRARAALRAGAPRTGNSPPEPPPISAR